MVIKHVLIEMLVIVLILRLGVLIKTHGRFLALASVLVVSLFWSLKVRMSDKLLEILLLLSVTITCGLVD